MPDRLVEPAALLKTHAIGGRASSRRVDALAASMATVGWVGPPVLTCEHAGRSYLLDGHHRRVAARRVGLAAVPCLVLDAAEVRARFGYTDLNQVALAHAEAGPDRLCPPS